MWHLDNIKVMIPFYFLEKEITDLKVGHFIINKPIIDCEAPC
jgi:hypothetical protein